MNVTEITIKTYRSLYDLTLRPAAFLVLAGPNNAGKSNTADALDFLGEVHRFGLELALQRKGGYENIAHRRERRSKKAISFSISAIVTSADLEAVGSRRRGRGRPPKRRFRVRHEFALRARTRAVESDYQVESEQLEVSLLHEDDQDSQGEQLTLRRLVPRGDSLQLSVRREGASVAVFPEATTSDKGIDPSSIIYPFNDPSFQQFLRQQSTTSGLLLPTLVFNGVVKAFSEAIAQTRVYQLTPLQSRGASVATPLVDLERHGENLPTMVSAMQQTDPKAWALVLSAMRKIVPGLETVEATFTHDRRRTLVFREKGVGRPWTSEEISDGTVQSLALFSTLYSSRGHLIVIEEPENSVHPWIVRVFVDACREISGKQVIVTTHSPVVLGYVRPDELMVVWREAGRTHIKPLTELDPEAQTAWESGRATVFELLDSGLVRESVPQLADSSLEKIRGRSE
jgi:predicted ATPase